MNVSIRSGALIGVLAVLLAACDGEAGATAGTITTTTTSTDISTTTTASTPSTSTETGTCSAAGLTIGDDALQVGVPDVVADVRLELLTAAIACDFERLGARAAADGTIFSFGGDINPAGLWRSQETGGQTPLADMVQVLNLEPALSDAGEGAVYVWPAAFALPDWSDATEAQRQELAGIFGTDQLASWDAFGGYVGYRVGITVDGRWSFFVAGD